MRSGGCRTPWMSCRMATARSRRRYFLTFPVTVIGKSSSAPRNCTYRGACSARASRRKLADGLGIERRAGLLQPDPGHDLLAVPFMRHTDHLRRHVIGLLVEQVLYLLG